jgi:hypothetical protein
MAHCSSSEAVLQHNDKDNDAPHHPHQYKWLVRLFQKVLQGWRDDERIEEAFKGLGSATDVQPSVLSSNRRRRVRFAALTDREREVFRYLLDGLTSREIAELLGLSARTVEVHRAHVHENSAHGAWHNWCPNTAHLSHPAKCHLCRHTGSKAAPFESAEGTWSAPMHPDLEFNGSLLEDLNFFRAVVRMQGFDPTALKQTLGVRRLTLPPAGATSGRLNQARQPHPKPQRRRQKLSATKLLQPRPRSLCKSHLLGPVHHGGNT